MRISGNVIKVLAKEYVNRCLRCTKGDPYYVSDRGLTRYLETHYDCNWDPDVIDDIADEVFRIIA